MTEAVLEQDAHPSWTRREGMALLTDLYQLTMMHGHWKEGRAEFDVCFEYFFRALPPHAGFAVMAGLEPLLAYLENLRFLPDDIDYLRSLAMFDEAFLEYLKAFRLSCSVRSVREGTLVFPHEPIIQIEGSILETQLVETAVLNIINYQTLIATKAARVCLAAEEDPVLEFGLRRAHGPDGGLSGSRAAYIGGCTSTSNVLAGKVYDIPVSGTHAHSWVMSYPSELEAFRAFARNYPDRCVLLVDTYDTIASGVPNAIRVFMELHAQGFKVRPSIRLDSGDLAKLSKMAYKLMIESGLEDPLIVASNDLDEDLIADLKRQGAKINGWGVGTQLITSHDCPALNGVYKLVAVREDGRWIPRLKISSNIAKATDPGRKNLMRYHGRDGAPIGDVMYLSDEDISENGSILGRHRTSPHLNLRIAGAEKAVGLLQPLFASGARLAEMPSIHEVRGYALGQIAALPDEFKRLRNPEVYRVILSPKMADLKETLLENPDLA
jgi:nicotinate phosphoribosyltransferase